MAAGKAQRTVFVASAVMVAVLFSQHPGELIKINRYKQLWAIGVLTLLLAVAADFAPELAVPFSVAVVVGFVYRNPGALSRLLKGEAGKSAREEAPPGLKGPLGTPRRSREGPPGVVGPVHP